MAYKELVKNFENVRDYMRQFYVYGFRSRSEFSQKSARSYDDERRRIESWLGEYMSFVRTQDGKNIFLSIDSRAVRHNPLYKAWKAKSFTDRDITLHFILFDILQPGVSLTLNEIAENIDSTYTHSFASPLLADLSTLRKKLKEYTQLGLINARKQGKALYYSVAQDIPLAHMADLLNFYSETAPCGVTGSFLLDKAGNPDSVFTFKHHYITQVLDSGVLYSIFAAMKEQRWAEITLTGRDRTPKQVTALPLKVYISCQNGRQYIMAAKKDGRITAYRIDYITAVKPGDICPDFDTLRHKLDGMKKYIWGANCRDDEKTEHVEFAVKFGRDEQHIWQRLQREKRGGTVTLTDSGTALFSADVYDSRELVPWIRSFICRISYLNFSDKRLEQQFRNDIHRMYSLYGLEAPDDIQ